MKQLSSDTIGQNGHTTKQATSTKENVSVKTAQKLKAAYVQTPKRTTACATFVHISLTTHGANGKKLLLPHVQLTAQKRESVQFVRKKKQM